MRTSDTLDAFNSGSKYVHQAVNRFQNDSIWKIDFPHLSWKKVTGLIPIYAVQGEL